MFELFILIIIILGNGQCSIVVDSFSQKGVHVSDYCPKTEYCAEGTHVVCMFYDPNHTMSPGCHRPKNISMNHHYANMILEIVNAERSRLALGKEKGKEGVPLPRGYGMNKLKWDNELATFAQLTANQCTLQHDLCRSTKKFPDPAQTIGTMLFQYPYWDDWPKKNPKNLPGLNMAKVTLAITSILKSWFLKKRFVSSDMIENFPGWSIQGVRMYLEMMQGRLTHMGCGISAYSKYFYTKRKTRLNVNVVLLACNYSTKTPIGGIVYHIHPPTTEGYSRCGCPPGAKEDRDCLCIPSEKEDECPIEEKDCKQSVVLLPIISVENAPPDKVANRSGYELEINDLYGPLYGNSTILHPEQTTQKKPKTMLQLTNNLQNKYLKSTPSTSHILDVKNRFFGPKSQKNVYGTAIAKLPSVKHAQAQEKKKSLFSKVSPFKLPKKAGKSLKIGVQPRKDFASTKKIVKNYDNIEKHSTARPFKLPENPIDLLKFLKAYNINQFANSTTETCINKIEDKIIQYNTNLLSTGSKPGNPNDIFNVILPDMNSEKSNVDRLMNLLDNLEQEVKHTKIDKSKKEVLNAKIKKIYQYLMGKSDLSNKTNEEPVLNDVDLLNHANVIVGSNKILNIENISRAMKERFHIIEGFESNNIENENIGPIEKYELRPVTNTQNNIFDLFNEEPNKDHQISNTKNGYEIDKDYVYSDIYDKKENELPFNSINNIKKALETRHVYSDDIKNTQTAEKRKMKSFNDHIVEPLSIDRRKFYQEKLDNIQRNLRTSRKSHFIENGSPYLRPMIRPSIREEPFHHKTGDTFYVPDRARFIHGY